MLVTSFLSLTSSLNPVALEGEYLGVASFLTLDGRLSKYPEEEEEEVDIQEGVVAVPGKDPIHSNNEILTILMLSDSTFFQIPMN